MNTNDLIVQLAGLDFIFLRTSTVIDYGTQDNTLCFIPSISRIP